MLKDAGSRAFLEGDSEIGAMMAGHDWSAAAVGPLERWPQSLRAIVGLMVASKFPMFVAWGPELTFIYNDAYVPVLGAKHPRALGERFADVWVEIWPDIEPLVARALAGEATYSENLPLTMRRNGFDEPTWFTFSYSPVRDDAGAIAGLYCACTETTAVVLGAKARVAENDRLQSLFQQAPSFMTVLRGPHHVFELVNAAYLQLVGDRELLGKPVREAMPEVEGQGFFELLDSVYASGRPHTGRGLAIKLQRGPAGTVEERFVDFVYQPLFAAGGSVNGIFVQGHDVTEQYRAQEELRAFSDSIPALAWTALPSGEVERFNAQWFAYTGQSVERSIRTGWLEALHPEDRLKPLHAWRAARGKRQPWQVEYRIRSRAGEYRWFLARAVPQQNAEGRVLRWFGTTTDIDDAKRAQQALTEADRQKDEFLATLAHELRNPLAPIRTSAAALEAPQLSADGLATATRIIKRQVGHMSRLLDDLLDVSRITRRQLQLRKAPSDLHDVVSAALETARPLIDARHHRVHVAMAEGPILLTVDPVRLAQVVANLLTNAAKYTDPGGDIRIEAGCNEGVCRLMVDDSGIGIAAEALRSIFTMFAQEDAALERAEGGLGIGLALVKGLVELHGGTVEARSAGLGRGSAFIIEIPLPAAAPTVAHGAPMAPVESVAATAPPPAVGEGSRPRTILIAEDNADARESLAAWLRLLGHTVVVSRDGVEALELAERERPEVLVLDIGMPRMNGYDLARRLRERAWAADSVLVATTGWGQAEDRRRALDAGFDLHLTKPFDPDRLIAILASNRVMPLPTTPD